MTFTYEEFSSPKTRGNGQIWSNLAEICRIWQYSVEVGRIWQNLAEIYIISLCAWKHRSSTPSGPLPKKNTRTRIWRRVVEGKKRGQNEANDNDADVNGYRDNVAIKNDKRRLVNDIKGSISMSNVMVSKVDNLPIIVCHLSFETGSRQLPLPLFGCHIPSISILHLLSCALISL